MSVTATIKTTFIVNTSFIAPINNNGKQKTINYTCTISITIFNILYTATLRLSTVEVIAIVTSPVVAIASILLLSTALLVCGLRRRYMKSKGIIKLSIIMYLNLNFQSQRHELI